MAVIVAASACFAAPVALSSSRRSPNFITFRRPRYHPHPHPLPLPQSYRQYRCEWRATATPAAPNTHNNTASTTSYSNSASTSTAINTSGKPPDGGGGYTGPVLSTAVANTALRTLIRYFSELSRRQPFIRRRLFFSVLCIITSKLIGISVPFFFKQALDSLTLITSTSTSTASQAIAAKTAIRSAIFAILMHGFARIAASITHELRNAIFAKGGQRVGRSVTATAFSHLHSLELAFHTGSRTGAITRVIDRGTRAIMTIFRAMVFSFLPSFFELLLVCTVLFTKFSSYYVLITLLTFLLFTTWTLSVNTIVGRVRQEMNSVENEASAKLTDSLVNVEAVKIYNNQAHETQRYDHALENFETISIRNEQLYARLNVGQTMSYTFGLTALLLLATHDIVHGRLTVGAVVLLTTMLQRLWIPLDFLGWQYREVKQSIIDVQNLFEILRRQPAVQDTANAKPLVVNQGKIDFVNVSFSYPSGDVALSFASKKKKKNASPSDSEHHENDEEHSNSNNNHSIALLSSSSFSSQHTTAIKRSRRRIAIENLSFSVPGGSSVALVGASGSGKSTATRLLCRLYDVSSGKILIDGQDIAGATLASLRQAVSIVPQDTSLFNDTVAYNIRYGRPSASDDEVIEAAKAASIHDVIMRMELGYDTLVGERGVRLSGGERQRLSVARAFLKGSRIIVEDESTSALDSLTEMEVSKALQKLGVNRTRIIVAHRLSTIMNVDQVVVMKNGKLVEIGTFDNLVNTEGGIFKGMWERQQRKEATEEEEEELDDGNNGKNEMMGKAGVRNDGEKGNNGNGAVGKKEDEEDEEEEEIEDEDGMRGRMVAENDNDRRSDEDEELRKIGL